MKKIKRYYRKARAFGYNPWNWDAEPGDLMVDFEGRLFTLYERKGGPAAAAGELCCRLVKPPSPDLCAEIIDGEVWWVKKEKT